MNITELWLQLQELEQQVHDAKSQAIAENKPSICYWRDVWGNPFMQTIDPRMLRTGGLHVKREARLSKDGLYSQKKKLAVRYDREYVIAKINALLKPLIADKTLTTQEIFALIKEAIKYQPPHLERISVEPEE